MAIDMIWYGRGGQGVVTAAKVLAETALEAGRYFQSAPEYGPERAGAPVRAFTRLGDEPIFLHSTVDQPDIVVVLEPTLIGVVNVTQGLKSDGVIIVNTSISPSEIRRQLELTSGHVATVDATRIAIDEIGSEHVNTPLLGALSSATGLFPLAQIIEETRHRFMKKLTPAQVEANVRAIERAAREVKTD